MFATIEQVKARVSFEEIKELSNEVIEDYIERAERWIRLSVKRSFTQQEDEQTLSDLRRAVILLVEYLWYHDQPDVKDGAIDGLQNESIGSYSYTKKADIGESTGISELDLILEGLTQPVTGLSFFSISGPSRCDPP